MVRRVAFAVPGDLSTPTGGYAYDKRMIAELERLGWQVDVVDLGDGFPWPSDEARMRALGRLAAVPAGRIVVVDGLALGVLPDAASQLCPHHPLIALVHHPLALESGLSAEEADILRASERAALAVASRVIVTSVATARQLVADYAVPIDRIIVAQPGNDPAPAARGSDDGIVRLLSVGAVVPRKGFDVLIAALATMSDLPWHLTIVGARDRDPKTAAQLDADIARFKLGERVSVLGAVASERLNELYIGADLFVLASRFEGYGMAYAEAIAHGLPVIGTTAGAIPDTVPPDAAVLVPPDDAAALALALRRLIENTDERRRLAAGAREAAGRLPTWQASANDIRTRAGGPLMSFSAQWLALREPYDLRARNAQVRDAVAASFTGAPSLRIVDLACGTGSTLRALSPHLPPHQHWRLADNDLSLLARASETAHPEGVTVSAVPLDLNHDLEAVLDGAVDLVATSALLDLVSEAWLERLAVEIAARSIPLYAALSYDGRIALEPADPLDAEIIAAVNAHQRTDKGFGPALGPAAASSAIARFESLGYSVVQGASDWVVEPDGREFQLDVLSGWASAARDMGDPPLADIVEWLTRRRDSVTAGRSSMRVGHVDFFARPIATR